MQTLSCGGDPPEYTIVKITQPFWMLDQFARSISGPSKPISTRDNNLLSFLKHSGIESIVASLFVFVLV